ncbi:hypothetical protein FGO68_gene9586 [Halteria grandinella]|uniref:Uncharacterized protein n=1 Tax=Halteria grandinella TaxID=5974 RepID=A0A8J8SXY3_HALGN|nr:hypothetical protein FGO68_gene9586 [Halteria grandinella]
MDLYDKIYKRIIQESRQIGDKWYQKYQSTPRDIKEVTSLNFSFDFKYDENNPNSSNRQPNEPNIKDKFSSPTTFASPPTYETRASRLTEFQSDYQKEQSLMQLDQLIKF